jgi:hypothetical protein
MRIHPLITASVACLAISFTASGADPLYSIRECLENKTCHVRPAAYQSVREIDYRNFAIRLEGEAIDVRLSNGYYQDGSERFLLTEVHYLTPPNTSGSEYVLLMLVETWTERSPRWIAQVVKFSNQQSQVIQEFTTDWYKGDQPMFTHDFEGPTKTLRLSFAHGLPGKEDRCSPTGCSVTYKWNGERLQSVPRD